MNGRQMVRMGYGEYKKYLRMGFGEYKKILIQEAIKTTQGKRYLTTNGENGIWGKQKTSENDRGHAVCRICYEDGVRRKERERRMNKLQVRLQQAVTIASILSTPVIL